MSGQTIRGRTSGRSRGLIESRRGAHLEIANLPERAVVTAYAAGDVLLAQARRPLRHVDLEVQPAGQEWAGVTPRLGRRFADYYSPLLPGADERVVVAALLGPLVLVDVVVAVGVAVGVELDLRALAAWKHNKSLE